jgi:signal transduction histidine kinase
MSPPTAQAQLSRRKGLADIGVALVLGLLATLVTAHFLDTSTATGRAVDVPALGLVAVAFGSLVIRRRMPLVTLAISTVATSAYLIASYPYGPMLVAFLIAVYTVANELPLRKSGVATGLALIVVLIHVFVPGGEGGWLDLLPGSAWVVVPFAVGTSVRASRQARQAARAESVRQQVYEERILLAREVHDIVGHGLAAIQMQADVALHVDEHQSAQTRTTLESISRASSEAFEELRTTLAEIHGPQGAPKAPPNPPGIDDIEDLCHRIRSAGATVDLVIAGEPRAVDPTASFAVYRVVQESLTNVIRHGATPKAEVRITVGDDSVEVTVTNPGVVAQQPGEGHGVSGMRQRVTGAGGTFHAGPTAEGFEVTARIPNRGKK